MIYLPGIIMSVFDGDMVGSYVWSGNRSTKRRVNSNFTPGSMYADAVVVSIPLDTALSTMSNSPSVADLAVHVLSFQPRCSMD